VTGPRRFEVVAWASERRLVLYVPATEAATSVLDLRDADDAARELIAELTGIDATVIECDIQLGRPGRPVP
jgi:hypothetical protein